MTAIFLKSFAQIFSFDFAVKIFGFTRENSQNKAKKIGRNGRSMITKNPQPKYVNALKIIIHHDLSLMKQSIHCKKTYIHRIRAADPDPVGFGEFWPTSFYWIRIQILPVYEYMM